MSNGKRLRDRPTADLIIIFMSGLVGLIVTALIIFIMYATLFTGENVENIITRVAAITNTLIGFIAGWVAKGRNGSGNGAGSN